MKVFLDANVLISVLNKEYPVFSYSSRILSLASHKDYKLYTSPLCLAIAFYFSEKKSGRTAAKNKITVLSNHIGTTVMDKKILEMAIKNKKVLDLEDGLQYYSAIDSGCRLIITEDRQDFYFSEIGVLDSRSFFEEYLKN
jgi:predicted nucleic acid-binding protein